MVTTNPSTAPPSDGQPAAQQTPQAQAALKMPPFSIETLEESDDYIKLFIYGPYGSGKTYLAGTAHNVPEMRDVFWVDAEGGRRTLRDNFPGITVTRVTQFSQIARIHEVLRALCHYRDLGDSEKLLEIENKFRDPRKPPLTEPLYFYTVVVDSLSEVQAFLLYQILGIQLGKQALDDVIGKSGFDEYAQLLEGMRLAVRSFRDLPMNVILVAGEMVRENERKQAIRIPNFQGKLVVELPGFFDLVGYYQASEPDEKGVVHRRLNLQRRNTFDAKSRMSRIKAPYFDDPTMSDLATAAGLTMPPRP